MCCDYCWTSNLTCGLLQFVADKYCLGLTPATLLSISKLMKIGMYFHTVTVHEVCRCIYKISQTKIRKLVFLSTAARCYEIAER